ncbi:MAG: hypothetical protein OQK57_03890, partial [Ignavibacteriaceae bacterium]|nr:hypothetical protein [Ignavibacteriaceae bacterium]
MKDLSSVYDDVFRLLCEKSIAYWNYDERYDGEYISNFIKSNSADSVKKSAENPEKVIAELESLKEEVKIKALTVVEQCIQEFNTNCEKAGTIEISKSRFNDKRIFKHFKDTIDEFDGTIREWDNTLYALGEDWELNYDLESTRYSAIEVFFKFGKSLSVKNKIQIYPQFKEILGSLNLIDEKLHQPTTEIQDLERLLAYSKEHLQKILLSSTIPNLINSISDLRLPEMIDEAKTEVKSQLESIAEMRAFVKTTTYNKKIKSSDIDKIYPREFVSFNTLPKFLTTLEEIKANNIVELKNIQAELINLGNMADFGLESAITAAATEDLSTSDIAEIAVEGIKISQDKQEQLLNSFNKVCSDVLENLRNSIAVYSEEMFGFTESSKIVEIKLQLAKAKTRAKAEGARDRIFSFVKNLVPVVFEKARGYYNKGSRFYTKTRKQFGLIDSKELITSEISDFLSAADKSVGKLPYIYRRLFQLLPLENDRLYISRQVEENQLALAYNNWLKGGYASVIISSEKGGGITSFLNIFLKRLEGKNIVKRLSIKPSVYKQQEFLKVIGEIFLPEKFLSFEELISYLNSSENKQVVVVENLQHLYLRSVQGFICLKILTDIISKTSRNIFWITSSTLYANEFLNKAIRMNDIFGYHIFLKQIESSQILNLIKKRNSISGYNIKYEPSILMPRTRDFEKLAYE